MKYQTWKKTFSCLIAAALAAGCLAGCGSGNQESTKAAEQKTEAAQAGQSTQASASTSAPSAPKENVTLKMVLVDEPNVTSTHAVLADTPWAKAWMEATGITLETQYLADDSAMNLLFASGDLPDIIYYNFSKYNGGVANAIKDGIIEPINDYAAYAPDLMAILESNEDYMRTVCDTEGNIAGFPFIRGEDELLTFLGVIVRKDWLDDLGMEVPSTPDEIYEVLKAFKEEKGAEVPFCTSGQLLQEMGVGNGVLTSGFNLVQGDYYRKDGKVHYGYAEPEYKDVLTWLNKLYNEGLLDPNFQSVDKNTYRANIMNGLSGVSIDYGGGGLRNCMNAMVETDPEYELVGAGPLVAKKGDMPMSTQRDNPIPGHYCVITPNCKNKEAAVEFLNYCYTEEGSLLMQFGIEGVSYEYDENGVIQLTELITNHPDGITQSQAQAMYSRGVAEFSFVQRNSWNPHKQNREAVTQWSTSDAAKYKLPTLIIPDSELSEYSKLTGDISTYVNEMFIRYVTGLESLDTFETTYIPTLEKMGLGRVLEIQQAALDVYNSN